MSDALGELHEADVPLRRNTPRLTIRDFIARFGHTGRECHLHSERIPLAIIRRAHDRMGRFKKH